MYSILCATHLTCEVLCVCNKGNLFSYYVRMKQVVTHKSELVRNREKCGINVTPGGNRERAMKSGVSRENREGWEVWSRLQPEEDLRLHCIPASAASSTTQTHCSN